MSKGASPRKQAAIAAVRHRFQAVLVSATGEDTFSGVLLKHFFPNAENKDRGISDIWGDATTENYCNDYRLRLLNVIPLLKPITEIKVAELEEAIEALVNRYNYQPPTENHYRHLIKVVFDAARRAGYSVEDNIWGSIFFSSVSLQTLYETEFLAIPKSLTALETVSLFAGLTSDIETTSGEDLGLLMMLLTGCRNEEIVPINFSHFFKTQGTDEARFFAIYESATKTRDVTKSGGKTRNAFRFIPVPSVLWGLIMQRKQALISKVKGEGVGEADQGRNCVEELPVACFGAELTTRCTVDDLSRRARYHLREIRYESKWLATIEAMLISERRLENEIEEKEPTAYLLRRFYATMLYVLGFTNTEQEYLMGHAISQDSADRRDYTNEDLRLALWRKMEMHPLCEMTRRYGIEAFHDRKSCERIYRDLQTMRLASQNDGIYKAKNLDLLYQDYMMALLDYHKYKRR